MLAYKFLAEGARGLVSGFSWPDEEWVEVDEPLVPTLRGIHACRLDHLPYWLGAELWLAELDGEVIEGGHALVGSRGRLAERLPGWDAAAAEAFGSACAERARGLGPAKAEAGWFPCAGAAYIAAHGAGLAADEAGGFYESGFAGERAWQAAWLADRLDLALLD